MNFDAVLGRVKKNSVLNKAVFFRSIDSTNKYLMENDFASGTMALAQVQTAGRGKQGAKWHSGKGGLWFSFVINRKITSPYMFVVISSVAVAETLREYGLKPEIKWPNDVLVNKAKICGILIENDSFNGRIVTGIGVNLNNKHPKGLLARVTSVKRETGKTADEEGFFISLTGKLDKYLNATGRAKKILINKWVKNQADITGREINVTRGTKHIAGRVVKVNKDGSLSMEGKDGKHFRISGEVFFI